MLTASGRFGAKNHRVSRKQVGPWSAVACGSGASQSLKKKTLSVHRRTVYWYYQIPVSRLTDD